MVWHYSWNVIHNVERIRSAYGSSQAILDMSRKRENIVSATSLCSPFHLIISERLTSTFIMNVSLENEDDEEN